MHWSNSPFPPHTQNIFAYHNYYWILILTTDQSISNNQSSAETIDGDNSDEQSTGEMEEERIETEVITFDSDLLELVNNLFT